MSDWFGGGKGGGDDSPAPQPTYTPIYVPQPNPFYGLAGITPTGTAAGSLLGYGVPSGGAASNVPTLGLGAQNYQYIPGAFNLLRQRGSPIYTFF